MADSSGIDPRYDPVFQRGYDGTAPATQRAGSARRAPAAGSALQHRTRQPDAETPAPAPAAASASAAPSQTTTGTEAGVEPAPAPVVIAAAPTLRPPWRNPFLWALTAIGLVLVVGGIATLRATIEPFTTEAQLPNGDYWWLQVALFGTPIIVALGGGILAGVLFVFAGYWSRLPARDRDTLD